MFRVFCSRKNLLGPLGSSPFWSGAWKFSQLHVRNSSSGHKNGRPVPDSLTKMKNYLSENRFDRFRNEFALFGRSRKHNFLSGNEKMEVSSLVRDRMIHSLSDEDSSTALRTMGNLNYSVLRKEDRSLIDEILDKYLIEKKKSVKWFPLFLTGLKSVKYSWKFLEQTNRKTILDLFDEMSIRKDMTERQYTEILHGIAGLGIRWKELNESTRRKLLSRLPEMENKLEGMSLCSVVLPMESYQ
jgi:predicted Fe-S protein YdhL (DUF1289 family)